MRNADSIKSVNDLNNTIILVELLAFWCSRLTTSKRIIIARTCIIYGYTSKGILTHNAYATVLL